MKLFDDKGRLFGIFNIVDILIVVFLVLGGAGAYIFMNKTIQDNKAVNTYNVTLELRRVEKSFYDAIETDKVVFDRIQNQPFGTLVGKKCVPSVDNNISMVDGKNVKAEVPERYDVMVDLKLTTDTDLFVGKRLSIGTKDFTGAGYIVALEKAE